MFYQVNVTLNQEIKDMESLRKLNRQTSRTILEEMQDNAHFAIAKIKHLELTMFGTTFVRFEHVQGNVETLVAQYLNMCGIDPLTIEVEMLTYDEFNRKFPANPRSRSIDANMLIDADAFAGSFDHHSFRYLDITEVFVDQKRRLKSSGFSEAYRQEMKRIEQSRINHFSGHPVHYKIISGIYDDALDCVKLLTHDLHAHHRLIYPYLVTVGLDRAPDNLSEVSFEGLEIAYGGACLVNISDQAYSHFDLPMLETHMAKLADFIHINRHQILFFIHSDHPDGRMIHMLETHLSDLSIVELKENMLSRKDAKALLMETLADVNLDVKLADTLMPKGKRFFANDINEVFYRWYDGHLKTEMYPQYLNIPKVGLLPKMMETNSAYQELQAMIGLMDIKQMVDEYLNYQKAQRVYTHNGIQLPKMTRHMVFTGNPGTAKTTVARLIGRILKENHLLSVGDFYEVGRSDLVEKYVGWTARNVKRHFEKAIGSVLFIDEAYSLMDDDEHRQSFGDEAIATIVQEMENHREDVVVIFAGYSAQMRKFLDSNPGLESRLGMHFDFKDYSPQDLLEIALKIAGDFKFTIDEAACPPLLEHIRQLKGNVHFGNGRTMRNLVEQAIMRHASRFSNQKSDGIDKELLCVLSEDDFLLDAPYLSEQLWHRLPGKELN